MMMVYGHPRIRMYYCMHMHLAPAFPSALCLAPALYLVLKHPPDFQTYLSEGTEWNRIGASETSSFLS